MSDRSRITAVLGPTNTGKTHFAIERMLAHRTGIIGLPLRLLAREVYDRIVARIGPSLVALVTGEERIVPDRVRYWVCTVEAMPEGMGCDFLAVDEIQLCADPERGHVFTDRLLRARGTNETVFLGSETMRGAIAALVPHVQFERRERFSTLTYTGSKKISRMPPRSAIVGFSVDSVYATAELLRRQKGGAAVVMGALSPRTRNAQVAMYQEGDVDYLVATDAIGMGLNLDIDHVAFSGLAKFDGRRMRHLTPDELAQIAGRAGRHMNDGTFGVTGEAEPLHEEVAAAITEHRFRPVRKLQWRNADLRFGSIDALIRSLEERTDHDWLTRVRDSDDLLALKALADEAEVRARASDGPSVRLLWDVCRIPDFRGISHVEHASMLTRIYGFLHEDGRVPFDWMAGQVHRLDRSEGDIDTLSKRLAYIRTWTYVAQRKGWVADESHWREETRAVEDRLSDALHGALMQRFVDRRTSVLLRRLKQKEAMVAEVNDTGEVTVEGQVLGRLEGFRFRQDTAASPDEAKTLRAAAIQALVPHFNLRADRFYNAGDPELDFTEQGGLMWGTEAVGKLVAGPDPLKPEVRAFVDDEAGPEVAEKVRRRLQHFIDRRIANAFEPLLKLRDDDALTGLAKGFAYRMVEGFGVIPRGEVAQEVKALDQDARGALRKHGLRFGQFTIFMPLLLKPAPTRLRLVLWSLSRGLDEFPEAPPPGLVTVPTVEGLPDGTYAMSGYRAAGERAIRIDMLERLADMIRDKDSRGGFEANPDMLSITGMTLEQFAGLMQGLGYNAERGERVKVKPVPEAATETEAAPEGEAAPNATQKSEAGSEAATAGEPSPETEAAPEVEAASEAPAEGEAAALEAAPVDVVVDEEAQDRVQEAAPEGSADPVTDDPETPAGEAPPETPAEPVESADGGPADIPPGPPADAADAPTAEAAEQEPETEIFYTFTWAGTRREGRGRPQGRRPQGNDARKGGKPAGGPDGPRGKKGPRKGGKPGADKPREFEARPPRKEKKIDPDNPFAAALSGFKTK